MAYASKYTGQWTGPYPNRAGEFCGNSYEQSELLSDLRYLGPRDRSCNKSFRVGKPSSCPAGSSEEMLQNGFVGLYLTEDRTTLLPNCVEVDSDALLEEVVTGQRPARKPFALPEEVI